jgi:hypothetical protein
MSESKTPLEYVNSSQHVSNLEMVRILFALLGVMCTFLSIDFLLTADDCAAVCDLKHPVSVLVYEKLKTLFDDITANHLDAKNTVYHGRTNCVKVVSRINNFCSKFIFILERKNDVQIKNGFWTFSTIHIQKINQMRNLVVTLVATKKFDKFFPGIESITIPIASGNGLTFEVPKQPKKCQPKTQQLVSEEDNYGLYRLLADKSRSGLITAADNIEEFFQAICFLIEASILKPASFEESILPMYRSNVTRQNIHHGHRTFEVVGYLTVPCFDFNHAGSHDNDDDGHPFRYNVSVERANKDHIQKICDEKPELMFVSNDKQILSTALCVTYMMPAKYIAKYDLLCKERIVKLKGDCLYCNVPTCEWSKKPFYMITEGKKGVCPEGNMFCLKCSIPYHGEGNCPDKDHLIWLSDKNHLICPTCEKYIVKDGGCNHITCDCGTHFCSVCKAIFNQDGWPFGHGCPQSIGVD